MEANNLGVIFGPTLINSINDSTALEDMRVQSQIVTFILRNHDRIFVS